MDGRGVVVSRDAFREGEDFCSAWCAIRYLATRSPGLAVHDLAGQGEFVGSSEFELRAMPRVVKP
jgi:hypothetical protein